MLKLDLSLRVIPTKGLSLRVIPLCGWAVSRSLSLRVIPTKGLSLRVIPTKGRNCIEKCIDLRC